MSVDRHGSRVHVTATTVGAVGRVLAHSSASVTVGLVAVPVGLTLARGGTDLALATVATALVGAAAAGFCAEPGRTVRLLATPVSASWRRAVRLSLLVASVATVWIAVWAAARLVGTDVDLGWVRDQTPPAVTTALLSLAIALSSARGDDPEPGITGAVGALVVVLTSTALASRWPRLPSLAGDPGRWWWLAGPALAVVIALWRDPAARAGRAIVQAGGAPGRGESRRKSSASASS